MSVCTPMCLTNVVPMCWGPRAASKISRCPPVGSGTLAANVPHHVHRALRCRQIRPMRSVECSHLGVCDSTEHETFTLHNPQGRRVVRVPPSEANQARLPYCSVPIREGRLLVTQAVEVERTEDLWLAGGAVPRAIVAESDPDQIEIVAGQTGRRYLRDLWRYRELFLFLAWRDLLVRYKQTVVGVGWAIVRPLLTMLVLTLVFGKFGKMP